MNIGEEYIVRNGWIGSGYDVSRGWKKASQMEMKGFLNYLKDPERFVPL